MGNVYAYIRVSSKDQNEDRQVLCMKELQVPEPNIFIDKQSRKDFNRPQFKKFQVHSHSRDAFRTSCSIPAIAGKVSGLDSSTLSEAYRNTKGENRRL